MRKTLATPLVAGLSIFAFLTFSVLGGAAPAFAATSHAHVKSQTHTAPTNHKHTSPTRHSVRPGRPSTKALSVMKPKAITHVKGETTITHCYTIPSGAFAGLTAAFYNVANIGPGYFDVSACNIGAYYGPGHSGTINGVILDGYGYTLYGVVAESATVSIVTSLIECDFVGVFAFRDSTSATVNMRDNSAADSNVFGLAILDGATLNFSQSQADNNLIDGIFATLATVKISAPGNALLTQLDNNGDNGIESAGSSVTMTGGQANDNGYCSSECYYGAGIYAYGGASTNVSHSSFTGNGIGLDNETYSTMTLSSVTVTLSCDDGTFNDNTSVMNASWSTFSNNGADGFETDGASTLSNDTFSFNYDEGIDIGDFGVGVTVQVYGGSILFNGWGIYADGYDLKLIVNGTTINFNFYDGVDLYDGAVGNVSYATVDNNGCDGFFVDPYSTLNLSNSTALHNGFADVEFLGVFNDLGGNHLGLVI